MFPYRIGHTLLIAATLGACAQPSSDIAPAFATPPISVERDCRRLIERRDRSAEKLAYTRLQQDQISRDDNIRTFGIPSLFGTIFDGDQAERLAIIKAQFLLADRKAVEAHCVYPPARPL